MKPFTLTVCAVSLFCLTQAESKPPSSTQVLASEQPDFADHLEWVGVAVQQDGYHI